MPIPWPFCVKFSYANRACRHALFRYCKVRPVSGFGTLLRDVAQNRVNSEKIVTQWLAREKPVGRRAKMRLIACTLLTWTPATPLIQLQRAAAAGLIPPPGLRPRGGYRYRRVGHSWPWHSLIIPPASAPENHSLILPASAPVKIIVAPLRSVRWTTVEQSRQQGVPVGGRAHAGSKIF